MQALPVVVQQVFTDGVGGLLSLLKSPEFESFNPQRFEEAFCAGIVIRIAGRANTLFAAAVGNRYPEIAGSKLTTTVRVQNDSYAWRRFAMAF